MPKGKLLVISACLLGCMIEPASSQAQSPGGINYIKELKLDISTKGLQLKVENFNYIRN
jgi:hypothetical protein